MRMIDVAYSGVHQAYQLALAAHEVGGLRRFHCSIYDAPGHWGGFLSRLAGKAALQSRKVEGLPLDQVIEHPWPLLSKMVKDRVFGADRDDWFCANEAFDRAVAQSLRKSPPKVFIGTETCALHSLEACVVTETLRLHDCPQLHPAFLNAVMREAEDRSGVRWLGMGERPAMAQRKLREYEMADYLLLYSEVHQRSFELAGFSSNRLFQCPLWVDTAFWQSAQRESRSEASPLKFLFAGSLTLRKGIPFLLRALGRTKVECSLTLVGTLSSEITIPERVGGCSITVTGPMTKSALRRAYQEHDLFVLPSVADSFGFVALEAMACGLPVVLTNNCGAPVPDASWRIPAMNVDALAERLTYYLDHPHRIQEDRLHAIKFAQGFTPVRYRQSIAAMLREKLALMSS